MGTLAQLEEKGLTAKYTSSVDKYKTDTTDDGVIKSLSDTVDANGLKAPAVMKLIGTLQSQKKLKPGLYKDLVTLNNEMTGGAEASADAGATAGATGGAAPAADGVVHAEGDVKFTEKQEEKIKAKLKKYEEKHRTALLKKEENIRARMSGRAEKRAQRLGMKVEEAKEITDQREIILKAKELIKAQRAIVKEARGKILALRPKKPKLTPEEKAAKKAEKAAAAAAATTPPA